MSRATVSAPKQLRLDVFDGGQDSTMTCSVSRGWVIPLQTHVQRAYDRASHTLTLRGDHAAQKPVLGRAPLLQRTKHLVTRAWGHVTQQLEGLRSRGCVGA